MSFQDYLDEHLGQGKDLAGEVRYICPFCTSHNDYKMYVHTAEDKRKNLWHCFKCGERGNPIGFVMKYNRVNPQEAKDQLEMYINEDELAERHREQGLSDKEILYLHMLKQEQEEKEEAQLTPPTLPTGYKLLVDNVHNPEAYPFFDYLLNVRQLPSEAIVKHNIGYVVNGYTTSRKGKPLLLKNHVVFFTYDNEGQYQYWNTRSIEKDPYLKSINAIQQDGELGKSDVVFNLNIARYQQELVIVEGVIDAITIGDSGVATFGKQVSDKQVELILKNWEINKPIYVMLDRDAPKEMESLIERLYQRHRETYVVMSPYDGDPNDLGHETTWDVIRDHSVHASSNKRVFLYLDGK